MAAQVPGCTFSAGKRVRPPASTGRCHLLDPAASWAPLPADTPQAASKTDPRLSPPNLAHPRNWHHHRSQRPHQRPTRHPRPFRFLHLHIRFRFLHLHLCFQNKSRKRPAPFAAAPWSNALSPPTCGTTAVPRLVPTTVTERTPAAYVLLSDFVPSPRPAGVPLQARLLLLSPLRHGVPGPVSFLWFLRHPSTCTCAPWDTWPLRPPTDTCQGCLLSPPAASRLSPSRNVGSFAHLLVCLSVSAARISPAWERRWLCKPRSEEAKGPSRQVVERRRDFS